MSFLGTLFGDDSNDPHSDPTWIGSLAIKRGWATPDDVRRAVEKQEKITPLGEILVEDGVLTREQLDELLFEQAVAKERSSVKQCSMRARRRSSQVREFTEGMVENTSFLREFAKNH
jgi:dephospho-CoA kinase